MATTLSPRRATRSTPAARRRGGGWVAYLFMLPYLVIFGGFIVLPAVYGIWISLHDYDFALPVKPWVGLQNYQDLFSPGSRVYSEFWESMRATGIFTVLSVPCLVVIPLGLALLLNRKFPGRTFFRAIFFLPYVLGVAVIGLLARYILDPNIGVVNYYLGKVGLSHTIPWTTDLPWVWVTLVGVTVWWTLGFNAVIYLAGLQDIPPELYEAARMDGAGKVQQFRHVTLPGLRPVLVFVVTTTLLASANMFGQSFLITKGAPGNATRTAIAYIADEGLVSFRMGSAAAMSYVLALFLLVVSLVVFRLFREKEAA
ncbi:carbohydrate ABC transporter membrane protein 1 (CUT1 family) [Motilibacter rhizosphaerae]|uniref:Carbohydrate ABC transporter membrane protein 1 (CUT1 family) n=1 Tax=Motilibacter rhizosphaerae TaxID=598652 RepID=A0A4Q7NFZ3_9ACTN|nr:sugar ABC transporter permease [Motilibacter rhizosphaerae]RZS82722.1 carbohydrate ABC transporter membrane protein 1 (CUT1 family) [Motilibacter rhizosphaerae]